MNVLKASLDTRHENSVIGMVTQFDHATLELQVLTDGVIDEAWDNPRFELIAMKRDMNSVREVDQDKFTILSKEEHRVQIELKEQFLTCRGTVKMQLVVKDGSRLSTTLFYLVIGQSLDHDIVESHRDVAVLDELEAYIKQGFDDLAYQEQRMAAVEQSTNDLNDTMNANEAERNAAETKRSQMFETNETNRTQTFNNQIEEQSIAFSNAQTQREKDFSESQQNMSQEFETSQKERESDFNELQKSNQKTFETNEQKRQTTFSQSQGANKQTFTQNETDRQRIFESNESDRQESESQRVQNELERVKAETQRAEAEVTRQQKMTDFEEKATQLSEDLDSQVARVDEFVAANEEKLLGPHDKTDYMGNAHKSVKDANDANVEYILGEVNTVNYEGQHITATDTIEKQVRSAILKGQTLVNLVNKNTKINTSWNTPSETVTTGDSDITISLNDNAQGINVLCELAYLLKPSTKYIIIGNVSVKTENHASNYLASYVIQWYKDGAYKGGAKLVNNLRNQVFTTGEDFDNIEVMCYGRGFTGSVTFDYPIILEYQDGMENWELPYFTGMQSVKMPVLTTVGKNLFNGEIISGKDIVDSNGVVTDRTNHTITSKFTVPKNKKYKVSSDKTLSYCIAHYYKNDDTWLGRDLLYSKSGNNKDVLNTSLYDYDYLRLEMDEDGYSYLQIEDGTTATSHEPFKSNILSIDGEYRGIGDVCDTVDCMTGEVVERIGEIVLDENITGSNGIIQGTLRRFDITLNKSITEKIISDKFRTGKWNYNLTINTAYEFIGYYNPTTLLLAVESSKLPTQDLSGLKEYLQSNPITVQYELAEPVIKTVDLSGQKVYSYDGTTHYSCSAAEGALIPTLSIDVPTNLPALVSRQRTTIESQKEQIITLEQENEQLIAQNEVQDIDISLNQDAINFMLFAPDTMSLNDESRNNEGVNAMAAYLANQILKGRLDYTLVVGRYGEFKEDIDTILISEGKQDLIK